MKPGDVFFWRWNEQSAKNMETAFRAGTAYWCADCYCVAVLDKSGNIILIDTYNYDPYRSDGAFDYNSLYSEFMKVVNPDKVDLQYLGNMNDYETISKWEIDDYRVEDVLLIPCHKAYRTVFLKRRGAQKDNMVMINKLENKILNWERQIRSCESDIENARQEIARLK